MASMLSDVPQREFEKTFKAKSREMRGRPMSASNILVGTLGLGIGLTLSAIPLNADMKYRTASERGDLVQLIAASKSLGSTQFHRELALDFAIRNNRVVEVKEIAAGLVSEYPRNFFGWRVLSVASASSQTERIKALQIVRALDPYNPNL
jgi:hypothetical protein